MDDEKVTFISNGQNGENTEFEVLFDFEDPSTGISYIAYTDNIPDESGEVNIYACRRTVENGINMLDQIEDEDELHRIIELLSARMEDADEIQ